MSHRVVAAAALATVGGAMAAQQAEAVIYSSPFTPRLLQTSYSNTLDGASPTWRRATAAGTEVTPLPATALGGAATSLYPYHQFQFTPASSGQYEFYSAQAHDGYLLVYGSAFDSANALTDNIGGDDDMSFLHAGAVPNRNGVSGTTDSGVRVPLVGGQTYNVITSTFSATVPASGAFYNEVYTAPTPLTDIPDGTAGGPGTPLTLTLNVPDHGPIATFDSAFIRNLEHTWTGDLVITLRHVDTGTTVDILDRHNKTNATAFGFSGDLSGDYTFSDTGAPFPTTGSVVAPGTYMTSSNPAFGDSPANGLLAAFIGEDVFGTWEMTFSDAAEFDFGRVAAFGIDVTLVPEPASLSLLAGGALLGLRRRRSA